MLNEINQRDKYCVNSFICRILKKKSHGYSKQVCGGQRYRVGEMGEEGQRIHISSCKKNKLWDVTYSKVTVVNQYCIIYLKVSKRRNLKSYHHKKCVTI